MNASIDIARPAAEVFDFVADMSNNTEWQEGMRECRWTSDPPVRVGSTYDQVAEFRGKEIVSSFEVTELEPGRQIRIVSTSGPMPLDITRSVEPTRSDASRVTAVVRGDPGQLFKLAATLMKPLVQHRVRADYRRLKTLLESG